MTGTPSRLRPHIAAFGVKAALCAMVVGSVIPASAQVPPARRGDDPNSNHPPRYVDSADYERQPYYVDGVEYKPYVPDKKKAKPAADAVKAAPQPVTPDSTPQPDLHPYVPPSAPSASKSSETSSHATQQTAAASSSSSSDEPVVPKKRQRYGVAIIEALDKISSESVRFEAPIGQPIRYKGLIYTVKACETTAPDEAFPDVIAYMAVRTNPVSETKTAPEVKSKEIFHGWTYASTPGLNPLQHPIYDAWVIACRKPLAGAAQGS
ncbi:MAG TPA: DUF2155 domain-containing protein [Asticcacaulis sp.]|nr:DUF2155 domain-containing protein [Asticcacaulis sp.]